MARNYKRDRRGRFARTAANRAGRALAGRKAKSRGGLLKKIRSTKFAKGLQAGNRARVSQINREEAAFQKARAARLSGTHLKR